MACPAAAAIITASIAAFWLPNVQQLQWRWLHWAAAASVVGEAQKIISAGGAARVDFESAWPEPQVAAQRNERRDSIVAK